MIDISMADFPSTSVFADVEFSIIASSSLVRVSILMLFMQTSDRMQ